MRAHLKVFTLIASSNAEGQLLGDFGEQSLLIFG
jgi:hypothetical protein